MQGSAMSPTTGADEEPDPPAVSGDDQDPADVAIIGGEFNKDEIVRSSVRDSNNMNSSSSSVVETSSSHRRRPRLGVGVGVTLVFLGNLMLIAFVVAFVITKEEPPAAAATVKPESVPVVNDPPSSESERYDELYYDAVTPIDGEDPDGEFGTSVSMCSDGSRVAIGAQGSGKVQVFELDNRGGRRQIGQTITHSVSSSSASSSSSSSSSNISAPLIVRSEIVVELSPNCKVLAIGYPIEDVGQMKMAGRVEIFKYDLTLDSWEPLGNPNFISGEDEGDLAGASLALSRTGDRLAIGSPGNDWAGEDAGHVRVFLVNSDRWEQLGSAINGTRESEEFGGSISLSIEEAFKTYMVAVGSSSSLKSLSGGDEFVDPESTVAARVYELQTGQWQQRGQAITPYFVGFETAWFVRLSADGKKLVISNLYLDPADGIGVNENSAIYVAAFELDSRDQWIPRGGNIHRDYPGAKTGYIISLSDNGERIGMGDPGREGTVGSSGHAHLYEFIEDRWCQLGPNIKGESGDMAGYSVALSGDGTRLVFGSPYSRAQGREHGRVSVVELHEDKIVPNCDGV